MSNDDLSAGPVELVVTANQADCRLDWFLAQQFPAYSRTHLRRVINAAAVKVNGLRTKASHRVGEGERITIARRHVGERSLIGRFRSVLLAVV